MGYGFGRLNDLVDRAHDNSKSHGFWDKQNPKNITVLGLKLALIHSEVSECLEAARQKDKAKNNFAEELTDVCIRIFDLAGALNINLEQEIVNKMGVNESRPKMHGKKA